MLFFVFGCTEEEMDEVPTEVEQAVEKVVISEDPEAITEVIEEVAQANKTEPILAKETVIKPLEKVVTETPAKVVEPIAPKVQPAPVKTYTGKVRELYPVKNNLYTGELTDMQSYKHFKFSSKTPLLRGDMVTYAFEGDSAVVLAKVGDVKRTENKTSSEAPPEGVLGRIVTVTNSPDGGIRGKVRDSRTGEEYIYQTNLDLTVTDVVYFIPGDSPVRIVQKAK